MATYSFSAVTNSSGTLDPSPLPVVQGLSFKPFYASHPAGNSNASGRFSFTGWPVGAQNGDDNYGNFTAVLSPTLYYEVGLEVQPGYTLQLNSIGFRVRRSGTGIRNYCVRSTLDNYMNNLAASTGTSNNLSVIYNHIFLWKYDSVSTTSDQRGSLLLPGNAYAALTGSLNFRFFAWNAEASGGTFSIDDVSFTGVIMDSAYNSNPLETSQHHDAASLLVFPQPANATAEIRSSEPIARLDLFHNGCFIKTIVGRHEQHVLLPTVELLPGSYQLRIICSDGRSHYRKLLVYR